MYELLSDPKVIDKLEQEAGKSFQEWSEHHKAAIAGLADGRKETYRKLRRQAATPEPEELELPPTYEEQVGDASYGRHLYATTAVSSRAS